MPQLQMRIALRIDQLNRLGFERKCLDTQLIQRQRLAGIQPGIAIDIPPDKKGGEVRIRCINTTQPVRSAKPLAS